jgi:hypothetical protein
MDITKDVIAIPFIEPCTMDDDEDELCGAYLSDEEILFSFLKEGCDVDGSPLFMATQREPAPQSNCASRTLH